MSSVPFCSGWKYGLLCRLLVVVVVQFPRAIQSLNQYVKNVFVLVLVPLSQCRFRRVVRSRGNLVDYVIPARK